MQVINTGKKGQADPNTVAVAGFDTQQNCVNWKPALIISYSRFIQKLKQNAKMQRGEYVIVLNITNVSDVWKFTSRLVTKNSITLNYSKSSVNEQERRQKKGWIIGLKRWQWLQTPGVAIQIKQKLIVSCLQGCTSKIRSIAFSLSCMIDSSLAVRRKLVRYLTW